MKHLMVVLVMVLASSYSLNSSGLTLTSPAFKPDSPIPIEYTCQGENKPRPSPGNLVEGEYYDIFR